MVASSHPFTNASSHYGRGDFTFPWLNSDMISAIVAVASNGVIGDTGTIPWYLPADLRHFKDITVGHPVIMGRTTYQSIVARLGHSLPERQNIVMTRDSSFQAPDAVVVHSFDEALLAATSPDVYVIGGAHIYKLAANQIERWYVTEVDADVKGDTSLEGFNKSEFTEIASEPHSPDEKNPYYYSFVVYDKK